MDSSNKKRYVLTAVAAAAAGATGVLWLKRSLRQQGVAPTDFDAFLHTPVPAAAAKKPAASSAAATDFESFLKVQPVQAQPAATDFLSFLKDAGISSGSAQGAGATSSQQEAAAEVEAIPEDSCPVLVLYGTEYGFAREIAEKLSQQLKDTGKFW
jgi:sulfite reductase (NADPH) flavoprotein alpha-component